MTDLQRAYNYAAEPPAPTPSATQTWALWFDVLREYQAAARNMHPLRTGQLFDDVA